MILGAQQYGELKDPGGVRFFLARNQKELDVALKLSRKHKIIVADGETGPGVQFEFGPAMPATMALGAADDLGLTYRFAKWAGQGFRLLHIDAVLTPQADVFLTTAPSIIGWRSFGSNPNKVAAHAGAYIDGLRKGGVFPIVKHYPGHGMTPYDTHDQLGVISAPIDQVIQTHLLPFRKLVKSGRSFGIMVGNLYLPSRQKRQWPAAMSSYWMDILRNDYAFDGLVITDSANMNPVQDLPGGESLFTVEAFRQGVDLITEPIKVEADYQAIRAAMDSGRISKQMIRQRLRRLDVLFSDVTTLRKTLEPDEANWKVEGETIAWKLLKKGTIEFGRRQRPTAYPLSNSDFYIVGHQAVNARLTDFWRKLKLQAPITIQQFNPANLPTTSPVYLIYWHGGTGIAMDSPWTPQEWSWLEQAEKAGTPVTVIVFGNPIAGYMLKDFANVNGFVAWGRSDLSCQAAAAWMKHELIAGGHWPFEQ